MCNVSVTISVSYVSAQEERNGGVVLMEDSAIIDAYAMLVLSTAYLIDGSYNPFLYFRF